MKKTWMNLLLLSAMAILPVGHSQSQTEPANITVTTDHPTIKAGSDVWVKVTMKNTSTEPIDCSVVSSNGVDRRYSFEVWGPDGQALPKIPHKHPELDGAGSIHLCTLQAGESTTAEENWLNHLFDMSQTGTYTVQVSRVIHPPSGEGAGSIE